MENKQTVTAQDALMEYAGNYLDSMKKDYLKMKDRCDAFERDHMDYCARIGLDLDAFNIELHPDHPMPEIFQKPNISDRDLVVVAEYMRSREKMYLMEQCVKNVPDDGIRQIACAYYLERKSQPEIADELGITKGTVSKKLTKAETGPMLEIIIRYLNWKYDVLGESTCYWTDEWELQYMRHRDALRGIMRMPGLDKALKSIMKPIKKMGLY